MLKYSACLLYSCKYIKVNYLAYFTIVSGDILKYNVILELLLLLINNYYFFY